MKNIKKKLISVVLSIIMSSALFSLCATDVEAIPTAPIGNVQQRIASLKNLFPNNSYFSANGSACVHTTFSTCNNCELLNIMMNNPNLRYSGLQGNFNAYTCKAFARYAYFYVFEQPWNSAVSSNAILVNAVNARRGYIYIWSTPHSGMSLENGNFFHSNITVTNQVSYETPFSATTTEIYRSNNYDQINHSHTFTSYKYYDTSSGGKRHKRCCSCGAWDPSYVASYCTYNSNNVCTICGTSK